MKGLLLSFLFFVLYIFLSVPVLRKFKGRKYFKPILWEAVGIWILYSSCLYYFSPHPFAEFVNGLISLVILCLSYINFIYGSFLTGFSTGILIKTLQKEKEGITLENLLEAYGSKEKIDRVLKPRIHNLIQGHYILEDKPNHFQLLPKGQFWARMTTLIKKSLDMGPGG